MAEQPLLPSVAAPVALRPHRREACDEAAFQRLYASVGPDVFLFAVRRLSPDQAKDVVNDTFEVVWRKRAQLPACSTEWPAWVVGVARNKIRQELSRQRRRPVASALDALHVLRREDLERASGQEVAESVVDSLASRDIYRRLSDDERELFDLAHLQCLSPQDGARVLGISVTAYTSRVSRLRMRIVSLSEDPVGSD